MPTPRRQAADPGSSSGGEECALLWPGGEGVVAWRDHTIGLRPVGSRARKECACAHAPSEECWHGGCTWNCRTRGRGAASAPRAVCVRACPPKLRAQLRHETVKARARAQNSQLGRWGLRTAVHLLRRRTRRTWHTSTACSRRTGPSRQRPRAPWRTWTARKSPANPRCPSGYGRHVTPVALAAVPG